MDREARLAALVGRYFAVLNGADPEGLRDILAPDFRDEDPLADGAGVAEVIARVRLYRAALPDAHSTVEAIIAHGDGAATATIVWVTAATGLDGSTGRVAYRYRAELALRDSRIGSHRVVSVEPAGAA